MISPSGSPTMTPRSYANDFGDALRVGGSTALDETDSSLVSFDIEAFRAFTRGYLSGIKDELTRKELELLPFSVKLLTYKCGVRFLADYLNGDTYFMTCRAGQNLDRARNQFKLVEDIAAKEAELTNIVKGLCGCAT